MIAPPCPHPALRHHPPLSPRKPTRRRQRSWRPNRRDARSIARSSKGRSRKRSGRSRADRPAERNGGLQGIIDHALVGHFVGFEANAAIGVSWQIFLVVIVFIASLHRDGRARLALRRREPARQGQSRRLPGVSRVALPRARSWRRSATRCSRPARTRPCAAGRAGAGAAVPADDVFFSIGMLLFFMLGGAMRAAGDARTRSAPGSR